jgi:lipase chaperone LimK
MTSMNIPLMLQEHGRATVDELDREIRAMTERLAQLVHQRVMVQAHMTLGEATQRAAVIAVLEEPHATRE